MRLHPLQVFCVLIAAGPALAGGPERVAPVTDPLVRKECGECHMAFQPGLLPAGSWRRIMQTLADHFGDRATVPPDQVQAITAYLTAHAGGGDSALVRITDQGWWLREHRKTRSSWSKPGIKSKSNCQACHRDADAGNYDDD
jgi:hypothetical protein